MKASVYNGPPNVRVKNVKDATVVGVFDERHEADRAIDDLVKAGVRNNQIGVVTRDAQGKTVVKKRGGRVTRGLRSRRGRCRRSRHRRTCGAGSSGWRHSRDWPRHCCGNSRAILTNAAGGAAIAGLSGALIGWGMPEEHAK